MHVEERRRLEQSWESRPRRRDARYISCNPVEVQRYLRFGPSATRGVSLDISRRGMSAVVCGAPKVGETVVIQLPFLDRRVELLATVRHSTNARSGFEFYPLGPEEQEAIRDWIHGLRQNEGALIPRLYNSVARIEGAEEE